MDRKKDGQKERLIESKEYRKKDMKVRWIKRKIDENKYGYREYNNHNNNIDR